MKRILKIAIVSDIHCSHADNTSSSKNLSYLTTDLLPSPINRHPVESLKKIIAENSLTADLLLCPGDITDKVDKSGLNMGWKYLNELNSELKSSELVATPGNHDVDSRKIHGSDPFDMSKRLGNKFPSVHSTANASFWSDNFSIIESEFFEVLIFNSCYTHTDQTSALKCQISDLILENINSVVSARKDNQKVKIAMMHHHPMHHSNITYRDSDFIDNGDELLRILEAANYSICIHGHKHDPRLNYYNKKLPVLAAGSFSSMMNLLELSAQNTFHFIELETDSKKGIIKTWVFSPRSGWTQKNGTYFPCITGFGYSDDVLKLANACGEWFNENKKDYVEYKKLVDQFPDLQHLIPSEQIELNAHLISKYNIKLMPQLPDMATGVTKIYS